MSTERQYITLAQILSAQCGSNQVSFEAGSNMKIKFTFTNIAVSVGPRTNTSRGIGYISEGQQEDAPIMIEGQGDEVEVQTHSNSVHLVLEDGSNGMVLVGFQGKVK